MTSPHGSPERAFSLQKYLLLHSQHEALQREIANSLKPEVVATPSTKRDEKASKSSTRTTRVYSRDISGPRTYLVNNDPSALSTSESPQYHESQSSCSRQTSTSISASTSPEIATSKCKLQQVNLQIKKTLMELLNCEGVRKDVSYRDWIQSRLMNVEKELRDSRSMRGWKMDVAS